MRSAPMRSALVLMLVAVAAFAAPGEAQVPLPQRPTQGLPAYEYHTYQTLQADLERLAAAYPDNARLTSIGRSAMGFDLWNLEVGNFSDARYPTRPGFYLDGGHHGNEALGIEAAYLFADQLLQGYGTDANATALVNGARIYITPLINPEGKHLDSRQNGNLVNLNRNYPFHWDERGTDPQPGGGNYAGPSAGSEPETQANMRFIEGHDLSVYVSLHTGSYDLVRPFGHAPDEPVPDEALYARLFAAAEAEGLEARYPGGSGESICWAYGARGVFSILHEVHEFSLRPAGTPQLLLGPLTKDEVVAELEPHFAVMRLLLANAGSWGARIEARFETGSGGQGNLVLLNSGWGPAGNVTVAGTGVALLGPAPTTLAPGEEARIPVRLDAPSQAVVRYARLTVQPEEGALQMAQAEVEFRTAPIEPQTLPGPEAAIAVLALALAARRLRG